MILSMLWDEKFRRGIGKPLISPISSTTRKSFQVSKVSVLQKHKKQPPEVMDYQQD
jgi:hypothetical protein